MLILVNYRVVIRCKYYVTFAVNCGLFKVINFTRTVAWEIHNESQIVTMWTGMGMGGNGY